MTAPCNIAHFNYGVMVAPRGDPAVAGFVDYIERVHAVAERSEGFVWRYDGDEATDAASLGRPLVADGSPVICSFSIWRTVGDFEHFVERTLHGRFLRRRGEWFVSGRSEMVLWNVEDGHLPDIGEALDRLDQLHAEGPGDEVFTLADLKAREVPA